MKPNSPLLGRHFGTCSNTTEGVAANLLLTIYGATDTALHGELALFGDLVGGGVFQGTIDNGLVTFTTVPATQVAITWRGTISGGTLTGDYAVRCYNPEVKPATRHQAGVWSCKLVRSLIAPDPDEAAAVWVYHDGTEEGPFTPDEFTQRLNACTWRRNSIVGLNNRTKWTTTGDCWTQLQRIPTPEIYAAASNRTINLWRRITKGWGLLQMLPHSRVNRRKSPRRKSLIFTPASAASSKTGHIKNIFYSILMAIAVIGLTGCKFSLPSSSAGLGPPGTVVQGTPWLTTWHPNVYVAPYEVYSGGAYYNTTYYGNVVVPPCSHPQDCK